MHVQPSSSQLMGTVSRVLPGQYQVHTGQRMLTCTRTGAAARETKTKTAKRQTLQEIVVGDEVTVLETHPGGGQIMAVQPRRSQLVRRAVASRHGAATGAQVIAANIDQVVFVLAAANPEPHWNLLDRYLVSAHSTDLPALVCITKMDLAQGTSQESKLNAALDEYRRIGYRVVCTSARDGTGMDDLRALLDGRTSVLFGSSGVGKTSLLNALSPGLGERVNAVNPVTGDGRHTTTATQIFPLAWGMIVDTPGVREFGLWDVDADSLDAHFPEMQPYLGRCRFRANCSHTDEPGCAVRQAVADGKISPRRFNSYLRLREDG